MQTELDLAWLAGIIDGEGSVLLTRMRAGKMTVPQISISSTTKEILVECQRITGGGSIRTHKAYKEHHKPSWIWSIRYDRALSILEQVVPHLREPVKRARASLLLSKYKSVTKRNGKYTEKEQRERLKLDEEFKALDGSAEN